MVRFHYNTNPKIYTDEDIASIFNDSLYYFVEASSAYARRNYPWTAHILIGAISGCVKLLRNRYDKEYAFLGLKKINEILPAEEYCLIEKAFANLNEDGFQKANEYILNMFDIVYRDMKDSVRHDCNHKFYEWCKKNVNITLFSKE